MAYYSTPIGVCAVGKHKIAPPKGTPSIKDVGAVGYRSPKPPITRSSTSTDERNITRTSYDYTFERLCRRHYLEAYAEVYPSEPLPDI